MQTNYLNVMGSSLIAKYTGHRLPFFDDEKSDTPSKK